MEEVIENSPGEEKMNLVQKLAIVAQVATGLAGFGAMIFYSCMIQVKV